VHLQAMIAAAAGDGGWRLGVATPRNCDIVQVLECQGWVELHLWGRCTMDAWRTV
jgi:hypothetical protein